MRFLLMLVIAFAVLLLVSCAAAGPERYLTQEQDDHMAKVCEDGCEIVPDHVWAEILTRLRAKACI